jgi:hypothetical protein
MGEQVIEESAIAEKLWSPQSAPQRLAYETTADVTLYGGNPGSGKTAILLILAAKAHRRSIIFRRTYPRLKGIIETSKQMLNGIARYNSQDKLWRNIPGDRIIEFGAVQYEDDMYAYQGREHDLKCFDEITEFSETQFRFICGWVRSPIPDQKCRVVATCNPPTTQEGKWIVNYWAPWLKKNHPNPAAPGEIRWFISYTTVDPDTGERKDVDEEVPGPEPVEKDGSTYRPQSRTFIPAKLEDNPYLRDTNYLSTLQQFPEPLRSILLGGEFDIDFAVDYPMQVIPSAWVVAAQKRWQARKLPIQELLAVDVARGGADQLVIGARHDEWVHPFKVVPGIDVTDGKKAALQVIDHAQFPGLEIRVDVIGYGSSCYDFLIDLGQNAVPMNAGWAAKDNEGKLILDESGMFGFENFRALMHWRMREMLDPAKGYNIALPPDDELKEELTASEWDIKRMDDPDYPNVYGLISIEKKEKVKKKIGRSPDKGDTCMMLFTEPIDRTEDPAGEWLKNL